MPTKKMGNEAGIHYKHWKEEPFPPSVAPGPLRAAHCGPLPIHGAGGFSGLLYLNTWFQSTCRACNFGLMDNFNLFWNRPSFHKADGIHPNRLGSLMLAAKIGYAVQHAPHDCLPATPPHQRLLSLRPHHHPLTALFPSPSPPTGPSCHCHFHRPSSL